LAALRFTPSRPRTICVDSGALTRACSSVLIGQGGSTICLGLLFDTLIVRSLMTPSIATLLGPWFWWPQRVRSRPQHRDHPVVNGIGAHPDEATR
jgi:RND superfamily putative drug exporter